MSAAESHDDDGTVLRRLDAIDRDLVSIFRRFDTIDSQLRNISTRLDTLIDSVAAVAGMIQDHLRDHP